jgi:hypothetical protein
MFLHAATLLSPLRKLTVELDDTLLKDEIMTRYQLYSMVIYLFASQGQIMQNVAFMLKTQDKLFLFFSQQMSQNL